MSEEQTTPAANEAEAQAPAAGGGAPNLEELGKPDVPQNSEGQDLKAVYDVPVTVKAILGSSEMQIQQLLKLGRGAVVELDRKVGDAVDIYVNDRLVARGEVVIGSEDRLGITMTEIVKAQVTQKEDKK